VMQGDLLCGRDWWCGRDEGRGLKLCEVQHVTADVRRHLGRRPGSLGIS